MHLPFLSNGLFKCDSANFTFIREIDYKMTSADSCGYDAINHVAQLQGTMKSNLAKYNLKVPLNISDIITFCKHESLNVIILESHEATVFKSNDMDWFITIAHSSYFNKSEMHYHLVTARQ
jgi:hypothetical protein